MRRKHTKDAYDHDPTTVSPYDAMEHHEVHDYNLPPEFEGMMISHWRNNEEPMDMEACEVEESHHHHHHHHDSSLLEYLGKKETKAERAARIEKRQANIKKCAGIRKKMLDNWGHRKSMKNMYAKPAP